MFFLPLNITNFIFTSLIFFLQTSVLQDFLFLFLIPVIFQKFTYYIQNRDVNLHPSVEISAGRISKTEFFPPWGRGWREKLPRGNFGAGMRPSLQIPQIWRLFIFFNIWKFLVSILLCIVRYFGWVLYDYVYFAIHYWIFWLLCFAWLLIVKCFCIIFCYKCIMCCFYFF
jgi:hypothetical protein